VRALRLDERQQHRALQEVQEEEQVRQPDLFRKGPSGPELRDRALAKFETRESRWLQRARHWMVDLLRDGQHEVSSDDVWRYCPPPADCHPSVMGPVFKGGLFVQTGWKASTRPSAHARTIRTYRLR
jgi:hypothetical protein